MLHQYDLVIIAYLTLFPGFSYMSRAWSRKDRCGKLRAIMFSLEHWKLDQPILAKNTREKLPIITLSEPLIPNPC